MKFWAIRMGDYIELRAARVPLKAIKSKLTRMTTITKNRVRYIDYPPWAEYVPYEAKAKVVIKQVNYLGGTILGVCKMADFSRRAAKFHLSVPKNHGIVEIPRDLRVSCRSVCL